MTPISAAELQQFRQDTPGTRDKIHLNNAGTSFPPQQVLEPMLAYLQEESTIGGYELEDLYIDRIQEFYSVAARFVNAKPSEMGYAGSNTLAWRSLFNGLRFSPGDEILTSVPEYGSNSLAYLQAQQEYGAVIRVVPNDEHGQLSVAALENMLSDKTKLVSLSHIPSSTGLVQKAEAIGKLTRAAGVLYLLDACQSGGQVPLDVEKLGCDALTITGRKYMRAPRGTGLMYVREAAQDQFIPSFLDLASATQLSDSAFALKPDAKRFETYEQNRAVQIGLTSAMEYAMDIGMDRIWERVQVLGKRLRDGLNEIKGVQLLDRGETLGGIVSYVRTGRDHYAEKARLLKAGVNLAVSPKGSAFDFYEELGIESALRASVHYYNTEAEIDRFLELV